MSTPQPIAWLRTLDETKSLHVCSEGDPGAIAVYRDGMGLLSYRTGYESGGAESRDALDAASRLIGSLTHESNGRRPQTLKLYQEYIECLEEMDT